MASIATGQPSAFPRERKRSDLQGKHNGKIFICKSIGCGRRFTRIEHLKRHLLNHSIGEHTCGRCRAHFKRKDLLDRHMNRHRQKDTEAGADGCGVLNTRKRMWKDAQGRIVTEKPTLEKDIQPQVSVEQDLHALWPFWNTTPFPQQEKVVSISPPIPCITPLSHNVSIRYEYLSGTSSLTTLPSSTSAPTDQPPFPPLPNDSSNEINTGVANPPTTTNTYWLLDTHPGQNTQTHRPTPQDPFSYFPFGIELVPWQSCT